MVPLRLPRSRMRAGWPPATISQWKRETVGSVRTRSFDSWVPMSERAPWPPAPAPRPARPARAGAAGPPCGARAWSAGARCPARWRDRWRQFLLTRRPLVLPRPRDEGTECCGSTLPERSAEWRRECGVHGHSGVAPDATERLPKSTRDKQASEITVMTGMVQPVHSGASHGGIAMAPDRTRTVTFICCLIARPSSRPAAI